MNQSVTNNLSWHGTLKNNPYCESADMNLYGAIALTQVLFTKYGAGLDMDLLLDLSHKQRVIALVTEILNIAALDEAAAEVVKESGLVGYYHRYITEQL